MATARMSKGCRNVGMSFPSFREQFGTMKSSKRRVSCAGCLTNIDEALREFDNSDAGKSSAIGLKNMGRVLGDNLNPQKARVLLMLALTKTREPALIQKYFDN